MQLRLVVPPVAPAIRQLSVASWSKQPGDAIAFGDEVCVLTVGAKEMIERDAPVRHRVRADANKRSFLRRRAPEPAPSVERRSDGVILRVRASDDGILRRHQVAAGDPVAAGDLLGVVTTTPDEDLVPDPTHGPVFRAIAESDSERELDR
jgi:pyruvate/2-oxoglutarate dehydrogenase complex dihydrolipoamide acyltransferase (E2) component